MPARHASNLARMRSFRRQNAFITGHDSRPNTMRMSALCRFSFCRLKSVGKPKYAITNSTPSTTIITLRMVLYG